MSATAAKKAVANMIQQKFVALRKHEQNKLSERALNVLIAEQIVASSLPWPETAAVLVDIIRGKAGVRYTSEYQLTLPNRVHRELRLSAYTTTGEGKQ